METVPKTEARREPADYRIEDRFGDLVIEASGTLAVHESKQAWLLFHSAVRAWKAAGKFEPHTGRRLVLLAEGGAR